MKVLIVGDFFKGRLPLSYYNAFKENKCKVIQFDLIKEYKSVNPFVNIGYADRFFGQLFYNTINSRLLQSVKTHNPEVVFIFKGSYIYPETLNEIKKCCKTLLINFNPDNPFNENIAASNDLIRKSIPIYDCYFIWGKFLIPQLKDAGAKDVEYLPFGYDPELHFPADLTAKENETIKSDLTFIGSWDKEREEWLLNLADFDLAIWGNGWRRLKNNSPLKRLWKGKEAIGINFSKICNSSKIVLNHIRKQNGNAHNMRTFEIPACRGFTLTTRTEEQCEFFKEGEEIICFQNTDELITKTKEYIHKTRERERISNNAFLKVKPHTYYERTKIILDKLQKLGIKPWV